GRPERGHRTAPVLLVPERRALDPSDLLAPRDQARAGPALRDFAVDVGQVGRSAGVLDNLFGGTGEAAPHVSRASRCGVPSPRPGTPQSWHHRSSSSPARPSGRPREPSYFFTGARQRTKPFSPRLPCQNRVVASGQALQVDSTVLSVSVLSSTRPTTFHSTLASLQSIFFRSSAVWPTMQSPTAAAAGFDRLCT